jgi:hypothetical protein
VPGVGGGDVEGRLVVGGGRLDTGFDGGRLDARGAGAAAPGVRGTGCGTGLEGRCRSWGLSGSTFAFVLEDGSSSVFFLWSRQHSAHRHSTMKSPLLARRRVSRQPNCALISV